MTARTQPEPGPGILGVSPYVPGKGKAAGLDQVHRLAANETPLGPSPRAITAFRDAGDELHRYPDGAAGDLRAAIARHHGLNRDHIVCGAGSDEVLSLLAQAYLSPGTEAVISRHGFLVYEIITRLNGAEPVIAEEIDYTADVDAMLAKVSERTRMVFLANPNNPTGTYLPIGEVRRLHAGLPGNVMLVLDAAYAEYVHRNDYESGIELVSQFSNVVMTRTFSKIYGLAALRLGWAYCPDHVADVLNRVRGPFNVSAPAIAAGVAALEDKAHMDAAADHNSKWRGWLYDQITALGLEATPSAGNFLLIHFPREDGQSAADADEFLLSRGVILRRLEPYHLPDALRLSVGTEAANHAVIDGLKAFLETGAGRR